MGVARWLLDFRTFEIVIIIGMIIMIFQLAIIVHAIGLIASDADNIKSRLNRQPLAR
jgi:hypothetical protein